MDMAIHKIIPPDHDDCVCGQGTELRHSHGDGQAGARLPRTRSLPYTMRRGGSPTPIDRVDDATAFCDDL